MRRLLAALLVVTTMGWIPAAIAPAPAQAASACTGWTSTRIPPTTIRVLRTSGKANGTVQTVPFKTYVEVVMASEWPPSWPAESLKVGAVAVKQYGWYRAMNWRGGSYKGSCYDVEDNTSDQVYWPEGRAVQATEVAATEATWNVSITKFGSFISTGYRSGGDVPCASDADGSHLYQHSARNCAIDGMAAADILNLYFDPGVQVWDVAAKPDATFISPGDDGQTTAGSSVTASWVEETTPGTTIASRSLTLLMGGSVNGSCDIERWVAPSPAWHSDGASPQTATGLLPGFCYRFVLTLTDSNSVTTRWESGPVRSDALAPVVNFASPADGSFAVTTANIASVTWTETLQPGTHVVSRAVSTEYAAAPVGGSCANAMWVSGSLSSTAVSGYTAGLASMNCYRFRVSVMDSSGRTGTWLSGILAR